MLADQNPVAFLELNGLADVPVVESDRGLVAGRFQGEALSLRPDTGVSWFNSQAVDNDGAFRVSADQAFTGLQGEDLLYAVFERQRQFCHACPL